MDGIIIVTLILGALVIWLSITVFDTKKRLRGCEKKLRELMNQNHVTPLELQRLGIRISEYYSPDPKMPSPVQSDSPQSVQPPAVSLPPPVQPSIRIEPSTPVPPVQPSIRIESSTPVPPAVPVERVVTPSVQPPVMEARPSAQSPQICVQPPLQPSYTIQTPPMQKPQPEFKISAISVMLMVGVVFVILAAMLFIRTTWESLGAGGRLTILGAGSVLFFGTSALAHKIWKLDRTGTAFYILGSAFLPISVWAAGYLELFGSSLSGASNPWLMMLSFAAFTIIALIAVRIYRKTVWGVLFLCGMTLSYFWLTRAVCKDFAYQAIALAVYALALNLAARPLSERLPLPISTPLPLFSLVTAFILLPGALIHPGENVFFYGISGCLLAVSFLTPLSFRYLKGFAAIPVTCLSFGSVIQLLSPMTDNGIYSMRDITIVTIAAVFCAVFTLLLSLHEAVPQRVQYGFRGAFYTVSVIGMIGLFEHTVSDHGYPWEILASNLILLGATLLPTLRESKAMLRGYSAAEACLLGMGAAVFLDSYVPSEQQYLLYFLIPVLYLLFFGVFRAVRSLRSVFADFVFPISTVASAISIATVFDDGWQANLAFALSIVCVFLFLYLALEHGTRKLSQHFHAVCSAVTLLISLSLMDYTTFQSLDSAVHVLIWSAASYILGFLVYYTTREKFHSVRRIAFGAFLVPPIFALISVRWTDEKLYPICLILMSAAAYLLVWWIFSGHGKKLVSTLGFAWAVLMLTKATGCFFESYVFDSVSDFGIRMFAGIWLLILGVTSILLQKKRIQVVAEESVIRTARYLLPAAAVYDALCLNWAERESWQTLYLLFTLLLCVVGWLATKKTDIALPSLCGGAWILAMEALRNVSFESIVVTDVRLTVWILATVVLLTVFCYLGILLVPSQPRRAKSLTITGGMTLLWFVIAAMFSSYLGDTQWRWIHFAWVFMLAGYLFQFCFLTKEFTYRRRLITCASACVMIACWIFPQFNFEETYFSGKAHLLPLIAFTFVLRKLYGKKVGGIALFLAGVYSMLALGVGAIGSTKTADLLTVMIAALGIFIVSFFTKQKKWFLLGGISLIAVAFYLRMKLFPEIGWWIFLLLIGIVLIVIAALNEICKQRGESLRAKTGRFLEDWDW